MTELNILLKLPLSFSLLHLYWRHCFIQSDPQIFGQKLFVILPLSTIAVDQAIKDVTKVLHYFIYRTWLSQAQNYLNKLLNMCCFQYFCKIPLQSVTAWRRLFSGSLWLRKLKSSSVELRSGDWLGQYRISNFFSLRDSWVAFALCSRSLAICTVKHFQ